ncbi:MAG TPA: TerB family tellurite resistance protein [Puia sp.]|jgi:hypothetical protein
MRKKWWVVLAMVILPASGVWAQSVADDIEQLVLDVEKLSQLKQMLSNMYQEYTMLKNGYEQIKGLSQGTFSLHKAFLDGLLLVSPSVRTYWRVGDIISQEARLIRDYQSANGYFRGSGLFTGQELDGFSTNYTVYLQRAEKNVEELTMVMTDDGLRMSDAERLSAIDRIDRDMVRQLGLLHTFNDEVALQVAQRAQAKRDMGTVRGLYGLGP